MFEIISHWIIQNWVEITGSVLGLISIYFQYKQNVLLWPLSIIVASLYLIVFIDSNLYAYSSLQVYYLVMSVYGWFIWIRPKENQKNVPVTKTSKSLWIKLIVIFVVIHIVLYTLLRFFADSDVAYIDSFITALSFIATWMLAHKKAENWLIWIIADVFSVALYIYKDLYPSAIFYSVLTIVAILGYREWKKQII